jgi:hypothetical protein
MPAFRAAENWIDDSRLVHILTAAPDLDLGALPDIARDRSPSGRAKLFAFLTSLLVTRWDRATSGERAQLAELLAVLWARGESTDRERLGAHFSERADIPGALQALLAPPAAAAMPADTDSMLPTVAPAPERQPGRKLTITVTQHPIVVRRKVTLRPPAPPATSALPAPADQAEATERSIGHVAAAESPAAVQVEQGPVAEVSVVTAPVVDHDAAASMAGATSPQAAENGVVAQPAHRIAPPDIPSADLAVREAALPRHDRQVTPMRDDAPLLSTMLLRGESERPGARATTEDQVPQLSAPRDNPHRLTPELLGAALASGDQARFEVMLASLAGLRAPLLRRVLRDSGDEAFAILARSIGMDEARFAAQWQVWQQGQVELGRLPAPADRKRRNRVRAFFAALTEYQIGRLVQRWRGSEGRVFTPSAASS